MIFKIYKAKKFANYIAIIKIFYIDFNQAFY